VLPSAQHVCVKYIDILGPMVKKLGVDLSEYLTNSTPSVIDFDNAIEVKIEGYKNHREYYADVSCYRRLNDMKIPTFFFRARDARTAEDW